jgi:hypothetical protein
MKNTTEMEISTRGMHGTTTNMRNVHTCSICSVDIVTTVVLVAEAQLLEFAGDVVRGP